MRFQSSIALGVAALAAAVASPVQAVSFQTGTELLAECASEKVTEQSFCNGFLAAMAEAHDLYRNWYGMKPAWCVPAGITTGDLRKSVLAYGAAHQAELTQGAGAIAASAFTQSHPCASAP